MQAFFPSPDTLLSFFSSSTASALSQLRAGALKPKTGSRRKNKLQITAGDKHHTGMEKMVGEKSAVLRETEASGGISSTAEAASPLLLDPEESEHFMSAALVRSLSWNSARTTTSNDAGFSAATLQHQQDTSKGKQVKASRFAVTVILLGTALVVTFATFLYLERQEKRDFQAAFEQHARRVSDSQRDWYKRIRAASANLAKHVGGTAQTDTRNHEANSTSWPFFSVPMFESFAQDYRHQASGLKLLQVFHIVSDDQLVSYRHWAQNEYQAMVQESHIIGNGNLDNLDQDTAKYHPGPGGVHTANGSASVPDYALLWEASPPPPSYSHVNWNLVDNSEPEYKAAVHALVDFRDQSVSSPIMSWKSGNDLTPFTVASNSALHSPFSYHFQPIHRDIREPKTAAIAGVLAAGILWGAELDGLIPPEVNLHVVYKNSCGQTFTFEVDGPDPRFLGQGALHDRVFEHMGVSIGLTDDATTEEINPGTCAYSSEIYPSQKYFEAYNDNTAEVFASVIMLTFFFVSMAFFMYDFWIHVRQSKLARDAANSNAIISEMFPETVRHRLMAAASRKQEQKSGAFGSPGRNLKDFMATGRTGLVAVEESQPMADLFAATTILFADIVGFTAWSSSREPCEVFTLLETIYASFDLIADRRRVYKVETVGDCYVAVTGIPEYMQDHAVVMARFAQEILNSLRIVTKELEAKLGPDTGDLNLRVGMHSGSVTAGVLRGNRSRFQLFGDTMNTASRMESNGKPGRIQVSKETADLLVQAGKAAWLYPRSDKIEAKGKGRLHTFWLMPQRRPGSAKSSNSSASAVPTDKDEPKLAGKRSAFGDAVEAGAHPAREKAGSKRERLVAWNVAVLIRLVRRILAHRSARRSFSESSEGEKAPLPSDKGPKDIQANAQPRIDDDGQDGGTAESTATCNRIDLMGLDDQVSLGSRRTTSLVDELSDPVELLPFDAMALELSEDAVSVPENVVFQLRDYVTTVANMYQDNAFHNFSHCSHMMMSVMRFLSRITSESRAKGQQQSACRDTIAADPLAQFACAFSALVHGIGHTGVPNAQLCKEQPELASYYDNQRVAGRNALDLAWNLLEGDNRYADLRNLLYPTDQEKHRFRRMIVHCVMATDIADPELRALREDQWKEAFGGGDVAVGGADQTAPLQSAGQTAAATDSMQEDVALQHLIQASDLAHTMQHWQVYRRWNEALFMETSLAFDQGRIDDGGRAPSEYWYEAELDFFDSVVIPLAKRLRDCGVFAGGPTSGELLKYAHSNRREWEHCGQELVAEMVEKWNRKSLEQTAENAPLDSPDEVLLFAEC